MSTSASASDSEVDSLSESSMNEDLEGETTEDAADVTTEEEDDGVIYTHITPHRRTRRSRRRWPLSNSIGGEIQKTSSCKFMVGVHAIVVLS